MNQKQVKRLFYYDPEVGKFIRLKKRNEGSKKRDVVFYDCKGSKVIYINEAYHYASKIAWLYVYGEYPGCRILFKNGDKTDLRIDNLEREDKKKSFYLKHEYLKDILKYSKTTGLFTWRKKKGAVKPGEVAGYKKTNYRYITINGKTYPASNLAWFYVYKKWPLYKLVHLNGKSFDDRVSNLYQNIPGQDIPNHLYQTGTTGIYIHKDSRKFHLADGREFKRKSTAIKALLASKMDKADDRKRANA